MEWRGLSSTLWCKVMGRSTALKREVYGPSSLFSQSVSIRAQRDAFFAEALFGQGEAAHEGSVAGIGTQRIEGRIANAENQLIILNGERLL